MFDSQTFCTTSSCCHGTCSYFLVASQRCDTILHCDRRNAWAPVITSIGTEEFNDNTKLFLLLCLQLDNVNVFSSFFSRHPDFIVQAELYATMACSSFSTSWTTSERKRTNERKVVPPEQSFTYKCTHVEEVSKKQTFHDANFDV